jgi:hypothetical protein
MSSNVEIAGYTVGDLKKLSTKAALSAVCGGLELLGGEHRFPAGSVNVIKGAPTINRFIVANPKAMADNPLIAKSMGIDFESIDASSPLTDLARALPVVYIADVHPEYGTMGFMLNRRSEQSMIDVHPEFRSFRKRPLYVFCYTVPALFLFISYLLTYLLPVCIL